MKIRENHYENKGRRHTKAIESFNISFKPKQNLFKTILENKACEYRPKAHQQAETTMILNQILGKFRKRDRRHTNLMENSKLKRRG